MSDASEDFLSRVFWSLAHFSKTWPMHIAPIALPLLSNCAVRVINNVTGDGPVTKFSSKGSPNVPSPTFRKASRNTFNDSGDVWVSRVPPIAVSRWTLAAWLM